MSSQSSKEAGCAPGSSLDMFVLILITFVTAAVGDLSCDEYCTSLKSAQIGSTGRSECNCFPQNAKSASDMNQHLDSNPIYYEPIEFHPLPEISFVYQPFVISNPTSSSNNKPIIGPLASQETEHHKKYKRKDNVIHKISIDSSKTPIYLDIDIKNSHDQSRSSQNNINVFDNLSLTEQDLKDCIDLHLLFHFRRNKIDDLKLNTYVENLEKYFHVSDDDLMMELRKRCKQPSDIVDQSLRQIKENIRIVNPPNSNYSGKSNILDDVHKLNTSLKNDEPLISISNEVHSIIPENDLFNNINKQERNRSNDNTFDKNGMNNTQHQNYDEKDMIKLSEESSSMIPIQLELNNKVNSEKTGETKINNINVDVTNNTHEHINDFQSIEGDISYRSAFNKPELKQNPLLSVFTKEGKPVKASNAEIDTFTTGNENENDKKSDENIHKNIENIPSMTRRSSEEKNVKDIFSTTTQNYLTDTSFVTSVPNLSNDLNIGNALIKDDNLNTSTLKMENEDDLEQSSSNLNNIIIKYTENLPESTTKNVFSKPTEKLNSNKYLMVSHDGNEKPNFQNDTMAERDMTTMVSTTDTQIFETVSNSEDDVKLLTFANPPEEIVSNNIPKSVNRTIIPENELQIPRITVTEHSNQTVDSTLDGIEEIPNNDYDGITNFEMDVADLIPSDVKSVKDNLSSIGNNETPDVRQSNDQNYTGTEARDSSESNEISGNLYFMFKKRLIPMRFKQASDGELKLILDGASFCKNLLAGVNNNGIFAVLCNSAVDEKYKCNKTLDLPSIDLPDVV